MNQSRDPKTIKVEPVTSQDKGGELILPNARPFDACPYGLEYQGYWDLLTNEEKTWFYDPEGLYSITVKSIATDQANRLLGETVVDLFCGCGGNAIAFARSGKNVIAVDNNIDRLNMARENAKLAGVADKIQFIRAEAVEYLNQKAATIKPDAIFLDPPWGGPGYVENEQFPLDGFNPSGKVLLDLALEHAKYVAIKLPDNFKFDELGQFSPAYTKVSDYLGDKLLHYTAYFDSPSLSPA